MLRRGDRNPLIWNYAGDITINNMLDEEGHSFEGLKPWLNHTYDGWATEAIYDDLVKKNEEELQKLFSKFLWDYQNDLTGEGDLGDVVEPETEEDQKQIEHTVINNVVSATHSATLSGGAGDMPGELEAILKRFISPKLPWDQILNRFFNELANMDYSWARPNRRYQEIYLPSLQDDRQGLDHILYFQDVSGSISDGDSIRFNSEFKYVKEQYQPEKMTYMQFDDIIQKVDIFLKDDPFEEVMIMGRGGTSLIPVREAIIKENPTAVVIFSDLQCEPMEPLPEGLDIPIIWVALNNKDAKVPHGQIVHLRE
jgi:predicted metal-dependent peptidase